MLSGQHAFSGGAVRAPVLPHVHYRIFKPGPPHDFTLCLSAKRPALPYASWTGDKYPPTTENLPAVDHQVELFLMCALSAETRRKPGLNQHAQKRRVPGGEAI